MLALTLLSVLLAQDPDPPVVPPATAVVQYLTEWPELESKHKKSAELDLQRLRAARTPEMAEDARAKLTNLGAAVAPVLLQALSKESGGDAERRICAVLEAVTGAPHTRLLAAEFPSKSLLVRCFTLRRASVFPDPGIRADAEAALAATEKRRDKRDPDEVYAAALCVTSTGSLRGTPHLLELAVRQWGERGAEMRAVLETVRGPEAAKIALAVLAEVPGASVERTAAALNLLSGCGDPPTADRVRPFLDSQDNAVRIAAINALRGIVDGDPPLTQLPVFEAIELAKQWKERKGPKAPSDKN